MCLKTHLKVSFSSLLNNVVLAVSVNISWQL